MYATKFDNKEETKTTNCIKCNVGYSINKRASIKNFMCGSCLEIKRTNLMVDKVCEYCNENFKTLFQRRKVYFVVEYVLIDLIQLEQI